MKAYSPALGAMGDTALARANGPLTASCTLRTLALTDTDTSTSLPPGVYQLSSPDAANEIVVGLGVSTAALPPASGAADADSAAVFQPGTSLFIAIVATTALHARVNFVGGTATLRIQGVK